MKVKRILFILVLAAGIVWNLLCLLSLLPRGQYIYSVIFVGVLSMVLCRGLLVPTPSAKAERSSYFADLSSAEKAQSVISAALMLVWFATAVVCLFRQ